MTRKKPSVICLDVRPALKAMTGVGTYIFQLSSAMIKAFPEQEFKLFSSSYKDRYENIFSGNSNVSLYDRRIPVRLLDTAFNKLRFPHLQFLTGRFDLFHSPSPVLPPLGKCKKIVTVHDLYFLKEPADSQKLSGSVFSKQIAAHLEKADGIICVSKFTAEEVVRFFNTDRSKMRVIYHGSDHIPPGEKLSGNEIESRRKIFLKNNGMTESEKIILFVGTIEPRKNPILLLDAFEKLLKENKTDANLVFAGGIGWEAESFLNKVSNFGFKDRMLITGYKQREELNDLYRIADVLVMPSKEEGFGLPLIEAMRFGVPIIAAENSSLPEIGGEAAIYFKSNSADDLADKLFRVLNDNDLAGKLAAKGRQRAEEFRWDKAAIETMAFYREVLN